MRSKALALGAVVLLGCSDGGGGDARPAPPSAAVGTGLRLRDVNDPASDERPGAGATVRCTGLAVVTVDSFDETRDGKSSGTIYVQDVGSQAPYSGIGTFGATFIPASLRVAPGDVVDLSGQYQENHSIGAADFKAQFLPQLFRPTGTFRFEGGPVQPVVIDVNDLASFERGRRWLGMLVTVQNVTAQSLREERGRVTARLLPENASTVPTLTNELYDLRTDAFPAETPFRSITGVVTYFFNLHLAPRSPDDLVR